MTAITPQQWMSVELHQGRSLCLVLDSEGEQEARKALLNHLPEDQYCCVYSETPVAELAPVGPFLFFLDNPGNEALAELLQHPERHWGWLASLPPDALTQWASHWRERTLIGEQPDRALYRFHDPRVLGRALARLPATQLPVYLGPAVSVCHWQDGQWLITENPAPGVYPTPEEPSWCHLAAADACDLQLREINAHHYLLAEHLTLYTRLTLNHDPDDWLRAQFLLAEQWRWITSAQLEFLLVQRLTDPSDTFTKEWGPYPEESPETHFKRVVRCVRYCQGGMPI